MNSEILLVAPMHLPLLSLFLTCNVYYDVGNYIPHRHKGIQDDIVFISQITLVAKACFVASGTLAQNDIYYNFLGSIGQKYKIMGDVSVYIVIKYFCCEKKFLLRDDYFIHLFSDQVGHIQCKKQLWNNIRISIMVLY